MAKWDPYIQFWSGIIGHKDNDKLQKIKQKYNLSGYHLGDLNYFDDKLKFIFFDNLQNHDRNIGHNGEDGWCCYHDRTRATNICIRESVFQKLESMI